MQYQPEFYYFNFFSDFFRSRSFWATRPSLWFPANSSTWQLYLSKSRRYSKPLHRSLICSNVNLNKINIERLTYVFLGVYHSHGTYLNDLIERHFKNQTFCQKESLHSIISVQYFFQLNYLKFLIIEFVSKNC